MKRRNKSEAIARKARMLAVERVLAFHPNAVYPPYIVERSLQLAAQGIGDAITAVSRAFEEWNSPDESRRAKIGRNLLAARGLVVDGFFDRAHAIDGSKP